MSLVIKVLWHFWDLYKFIPQKSLLDTLCNHFAEDVTIIFGNKHKLGRAVVKLMEYDVIYGVKHVWTM